MDNNENNNNVHITQVNPRTELNDLEKTAILQFEFEKKQEELSKTKKFQLLNSRKKNNEDSFLPKLKDKLSNTMEIILPIKKKKEVNLSDTIKLKLSDLRDRIEDEYLELPKVKKSLYDTVIIKLDDLINKKNALKRFETKKVTSIEDAKPKVSKKVFRKPKDITKMKDIKLNVDSEEYGRQLYNLNKIALNNLSYIKPVKVRKYSSLYKLDNVDKVHVSKKHYDTYQKKLNKFAINKLYYKLAPKETNKYKLYKYSVMFSSCILIITGLILINWCIQGAQINSLSNSIKEDTEVTQIVEGDIVGIEEPVPEVSPEYSDQTSMYWRYLNTPMQSVNFKSLIDQNSDTVGWLIVNGTNVNYPVVQTTDNDYYLKHAFDKSFNSAGWVYADFRDTFDTLGKNTVIYAHGRKDKVMFGSLTNTLSADWYNNSDNQIIQLSTPKYNTMWQVFSVYKIEAESYYISTSFANDETFGSFVTTMKDRSIHDFGINVTTNDKILTLSTCYNDNGIRLVVQAKLVKIQER